MNRLTRQGWVLALSLGLLWGGLEQWEPFPWKPLSACAEVFLGGKQAEPLESLKIVNADLIRVGIADDAMTAYEYPQTEVSATGAFRITDGEREIVTGTSADRLTLTVDATGFSVARGKTPVAQALAGPLRVQPLAANDLVKITNITRRGQAPTYRGLLEIVRGKSSPNKLSVVNILPIQDYLKAVVPNELPASYGLEAIKAQAIAARNYALRPREKFWTQFDICDSQYCQAYYGAQTETPATNRALLETEGLVGLYEGELILALYSSSHGGYAEAYRNAFSDPLTHRFPGTDIPYLAGGADIVQPGLGSLQDEAAARAFWTRADVKSFDVRSPLYRWERVWQRAELEGILTRTLREASRDASTAQFVYPQFSPTDAIGGPENPLQSVQVLERGLSGKAMAVAIKTAKGTWTVRKEFVIRKVLQTPTPNGALRMLPSANIVVSNLTDAQRNLVSLRVQGGGFGHGVGMSQLGASYMDRQGHRFPEIIGHYYQGVSLGTVPLWVGEGRGQQPKKTTFFAHKREGRLFVQTPGSRGTVRVLVNRQVQVLEPDAEGRASSEVGGLLQAGVENTVVLLPDTQEPTRLMKAWIELYPPDAIKSSSR